MAHHEQFEEIHRCLNHAFKRLSDLLNSAEPKHRQQMLRVMTLITQTADELAMLSIGRHQTHNGDQLLD